MGKKGTLIFFCGKMGVGKTTKSRELAQKKGVILFSQDEWLATLYPEEINDFEDFLKYSARLKPLLKGHVQNILISGISVVLDFPGNTKNSRAWFKSIFSEHDIPHKLIYLEASDQLCLRQISQRRISHPERAHFDTEEVFRRVTSYFEPPTEEEGFNIEVVRNEEA